MNIDFADLLMDVIERRASDLHITAGAPPTIRVRGRLTQLEDYPRLTPRTRARSSTRSSPTTSASAWRRTGSSTSPTRSPARRASASTPTSSARAIGAAFRLIPAEDHRIDELGLPPVVHEFTKKPRGFVLVTGPTGSGKSTTLAAMIDEINATREEHIMTVEDPIEFLHGHKKCIVNQREIGSDAQSFAAALKAALRQDPDVILVGEMRDLETIYTALTAAETGHLVFATLHTQDAPQTIDRIIDVFPAHSRRRSACSCRSRCRAS